MSNTREKALFMAFGLGTGAAILALIACTGLYVLLTKMPTMFLVSRGSSKYFKKAFAIFLASSASSSLLVVVLGIAILEQTYIYQRQEKYAIARRKVAGATSSLKIFQRSQVYAFLVVLRISHK